MDKLTPEQRKEIREHFAQDFPNLVDMVQVATEQAVLSKLQKTDKEMVEELAKEFYYDWISAAYRIAAAPAWENADNKEHWRIKARNIVSQLSVVYEARQIKAVEQARKEERELIVGYLIKICKCPEGRCPKISCIDCWLEALKGASND